MIGAGRKDNAGFLAISKRPRRTEFCRKILNPGNCPLIQFRAIIIASRYNQVARSERDVWTTPSPQGQSTVNTDHRLAQCRIADVLLAGKLPIRRDGFSDRGHAGKLPRPLSPEWLDHALKGEWSGYRMSYRR